MQLYNKLSAKEREALLEQAGEERRNVLRNLRSFLTVFIF